MIPIIDRASGLFNAVKTSSKLLEVVDVLAVAMTKVSRSIFFIFFVLRRYIPDTPHPAPHMRSGIRDRHPTFTNFFSHQPITKTWLSPLIPGKFLLFEEY